MRARALVAAAAALLAGCSDPDRCDPAVEECDAVDSGDAWEGETEIVRVDWGCCEPGDDRCGDNGEWWFDVLVQGVADGATLSMREAGSLGGARWSEQHALDVFIEDEDGWWQERYAELDVVDTSGCAARSDCAGSWSTGENTLFACTDTPEADGIAFGLVVSGDAGDPLACYAWGAVAAGGDCEELDR